MKYLYLFLGIVIGSVFSSYLLAGYGDKVYPDAKMGDILWELRHGKNAQSPGTSQPDTLRCDCSLMLGRVSAVSEKNAKDLEMAAGVILKNQAHVKRIDILTQVLLQNGTISKKEYNSIMQPIQ